MHYYKYALKHHTPVGLGSSALVATLALPRLTLTHDMHWQTWVALLSRLL